MVQVDGQYRIWYLNSVELDGIRGSWVFVSAGSKLLVDGYQWRSRVLDGSGSYALIIRRSLVRIQEGP
jgi:hypothetical protein